MGRARYTKRDYEKMAAIRRHALVAIADKLGRPNIVVKMLGSMAWGRNPWEQGPDTTLSGYIEEKAGLDGCVHMLKTWCREYGRDDVMRVIRDLYPTGYVSAG